ncbi:MAG: hypothetical protein U0R26_11190 [Solirubrobacterales bacterium]
MGDPVQAGDHEAAARPRPDHRRSPRHRLERTIASRWLAIDQGGQLLFDEVPVTDERR